MIIKWYRNIQGRPTHRRPFLLTEKEVAALAELAVQQHPESNSPIVRIK